MAPAPPSLSSLTSLSSLPSLSSLSPLPGRALNTLARRNIAIAITSTSTGTSTGAPRPISTLKRPVPIPVPVLLVRSAGTRRAMASSSATPAKVEWLVVVPDFPGAIEKRLAVRPIHFKELEKNVDSGIFKMGGAILDEPPANDEPGSLKLCGSSLIVVAESRAEALSYIEQDVYAKNGVWDLAKLQIWPFKSAFRKP